VFSEERELELHIHKVVGSPPVPQVVDEADNRTQKSWRRRPYQVPLRRFPGPREPTPLRNPCVSYPQIPKGGMESKCVPTASVSSFNHSTAL
jgi:hypothetical protein